MKVIHISAKFKNKIKLSDSLIAYLKNQKIKSLALFASTQFTNLTEIKIQLKRQKIKILTAKLSRTNKQSQILGCDCYKSNFPDEIFSKSDAIIYIGDGMFHPKALLFSQLDSNEFKSVISYNPISKKFTALTKKDIEKQLKKTKQNLKAFIIAKKIGILVTTKPGQQFLNSALQLKKDLEKQGKKAFIFIDDNFDFSNFDNFSFVQIWVNTACPRIALDDALYLEKPIINLVDAFNPVKSLEKLN
ncbi:MAG: diphthamide synthesis protein [Nanoarchaeota archaeon]|nr:diphthamide synthesis protein [Nanoarchaeota archaeon]